MRLTLFVLLLVFPLAARADLDQAIDAFNSGAFDRTIALAKAALADDLSPEDALVAREVLLISRYSLGRLDADLLRDLETLDREIAETHGRYATDRLNTLFVISDLQFELGLLAASMRWDVAIARIGLRTPQDASEDLLWALRNLAVSFEGDQQRRARLQFTALFEFMAIDYRGPDDPLAMEATAMAALALFGAGEYARGAQKALTHTEDDWLAFAALGAEEDTLVAEIFAAFEALPNDDEDAWFADLQAEFDAELDREQLTAAIGEDLEAGQLDFRSPSYAQALAGMNAYLDLAYPEDPIAAFFVTMILKSHLERGDFAAGRPYLSGLLTYAPAYAAVLDMPIGTIAAILARTGGVEDPLIEAMIDKALDIEAIAPGDDPEVAFGLLTARGQIRERQGDLPAAFAAYRQALDIAERHAELQFGQMGLALNGAGITLSAMGRPEDAQGYLVKMRDLALSEGDLNAASAALTALSQDAMKLGSSAAALDFARRKLALENNRTPVDAEGVRIAQMNLATILLLQTDGFAPELIDLLPGILSGAAGTAGEAEVQSALLLAVADRLGATPEIVQRHGAFRSATNTQKAQLVSVLAEAALDQSDFDGASRWVAFGRGLVVPSSAEDLRLRAVEGRVALAEGRSRDALAAYRVITTQRLSRPANATDHFGHVPYQMAAAIRMARDAETNGDLRFQDEAFVLAQLASATAAGRALNTAMIRDAADGETRQLLKDRERIRRDLEVVDRAIAQARYDGKTPDEFEARATELRGAETAANAAIARLSPDLAAMSQTRPLGMADVAAHLTDNEVLAIYVTSDAALPDGEPASYLVALSSDSVFLTSLSPRADLVALSRALRCSAALTDPACASVRAGQTRGTFATAKPATPGLPAFDTGLAHSAYAELIAPMAQMLDGKTRLIIVPDQALISLPFHLLLQKPLAPGQPLEAGQWLIRDLSIETAPTVTSFVAMRGRAARDAAADAFLGVGDPLIGVQRRGAVAFSCADRDADPVAYAALVPDGLKRSVGPERARLVGDLTALPDTRCELQDIAARFPDSQLMLQQDASERAIKAMSAAGDLRRFSVVNFATHGLIAGEIGVNDSGLVLSPPAIPTASDDGLLTTAEIAELDLDADFVILSACNTASGDSRSDEGLSGLASAFFVAGARSLMVSHWPVYSDAAVDLTTRTFDILDRQPGTARADAMRQAMLSVLDAPTSTPRMRHPSYWAPFMVVGDGLGSAAKD